MKETEHFGHLFQTDESGEPIEEEFPDPGGRSMAAQTPEVSVHHHHASDCSQS